jgi:RNA polymerase sigma-54 factor
MTPQLQQAIKLLALSNLEIEAFVAEAIEANPLIEIGQIDGASPSESPDGLELPRRTRLESSPVDQLVAEGRAEDDRPLDIDPTALDLGRDTGEGEGAGAWNGPVADWGGDVRSAAGGAGLPVEERDNSPASLAEHLEAQVGAATDDARLATIACFIIGQMDEAGYLHASTREISSELGATLADVEQALAIVQGLEPTGVGARSLSECIALQAIEADRHDPAMARLIDNLELVARGEFARLKRICSVDDEDFADMLAELRGYDPKPGLKFGGGPGEAVTPDLLLKRRDDGGWDVTLNEATLPRLIVNRSYYLELRCACDDKASRSWLSEKLADANWLIKALDQRQKTILKVAAEIIRHQDGFFRHGVAYLKPLTLRAVAEAIGAHESTVSRVTSNKYIHCDRGTFELKYLFSSGVAASDGTGAVSAEAVKAAIRQLIDMEDARAVLSDDALVDLLRAKGFDLARRTVAKYREATGLGSSVQRRRQKAIAAVR